jgi:hypothetical protein
MAIYSRAKGNTDQHRLLRNENTIVTMPSTPKEAWEKSRYTWSLVADTVAVYLKIQKTQLKLGIGAHACNPSYSRG